MKGQSENGKFSDMYTPISDSLVLEFNMRTITDTGIHLTEQSLQRDIIMKVASVGPKVEGIEVGNWVIVVPGTEIVEVPLYNKNDNDNGVKYGQVKIYQILGKVSDSYMEEFDKETIITTSYGNTH